MEDYIALTIGGRRKLISQRYCLDGLVSYDFVHHLEEIADENHDGVLSIAELENARKPGRVTLHPGCELQGYLREKFRFIGIGSTPAPLC